MFLKTSVVSQMVLYALEACLVNLEVPLKNYESVLTLVKGDLSRLERRFR